MRTVIIGAGQQIKNVLGLYDVDVAFIFDEPREPGERKCGIPVFNFNPFPDEKLLWIAPIRDTRHKRHLVRKAVKATKPTDIILRNLTHPTTLFETKAVGSDMGIYMQPNAVVYADAKLGVHTTNLGRASTGHDADVQAFCTLGHHSFIGGHVTLEAGVEIGAGAVVLQDTHICEGATIGAGAVVLERQHIPANEVWVGVPAKPLKERPHMGGTYHPSMLRNKTREAWR